MSVLEAATQLGPIHDTEDEAARRVGSIEDPGRLHGDIAAGELHWFEPESGRWLSFDHEFGRWRRFSSAAGAFCEATELDPHWRPWQRSFDDSEAPFYRWVHGIAAGG